AAPQPHDRPNGIGAWAGHPRLPGRGHTVPVSDRPSKFAQASTKGSFRIMSTPGASSYDALPYDSIPFPQSHPDRLHVIGRLFGMQPASPSRCRVLEIGCASGGNLIPVAAQAPASTFVGIDLSARQIADGKAMVADLGIGNVDLRQMDLADVDESLGKFD